MGMRGRPAQPKGLCSECQERQAFCRGYCARCYYRLLNGGGLARKNWACVTSPQYVQRNEKILSLLAGGMSEALVAALFSISASSVRYILLHNTMQQAPPALPETTKSQKEKTGSRGVGRPPSERTEAIKERLRNTSKTISEIAEEFHCSKQWVSFQYLRLQKLGEDIPQRPREYGLETCHAMMAQQRALREKLAALPRINLLPTNRKKCFDCLRFLPLELMVTNSSRKDGYHNICRKCSAKRFSAWQKRNREKHCLYHQRWLQKKQREQGKEEEKVNDVLDVSAEELQVMYEKELDMHERMIGHRDNTWDILRSLVNAEPDMQVVLMDELLCVAQNFFSLEAEYTSFSEKRKFIVRQQLYARKKAEKQRNDNREVVSD